MLTDPTTLYALARQIYTKENVDWLESTKTHIIISRDWVINPERLEAVLSASESQPVRFIPHRVGVGYEGGGYFFPIYDPSGGLPMAQLRWSKPSLHKSIKTSFIGNASELEGPKWCGMSPSNVRQIIQQKELLLVEGPFDRMACQIALDSNYPVLSLFGCHLTLHHIQDLQILGVNKVKIMFDDDNSGNAAYQTLKNQRLPFRISKLKSPAADPSDCLKDEKTFRTLTNLLRNECHLTERSQK
jgi:hypothetical protein